MGKRKHLHVYKCILLKDISGKCVSGKEFMKKKKQQKNGTTNRINDESFD